MQQPVKPLVISALREPDTGGSLPEHIADIVYCRKYLTLDRRRLYFEKRDHRVSRARCNYLNRPKVLKFLEGGNKSAVVPVSKDRERPRKKAVVVDGK